MNLAFGIVLYNTSKKELDRLLNSINIACLSLPIRKRIYIIDNSIQPNKIEINFDNSFEIQSEGNIGFGAGHNRLIKIAADDSNDFYIGVNPDGFFLPSSIEKALCWFSKNCSSTLFEFRQLPVEHPKCYEPRSGYTNWCSGAAFAAKIQFLMKVGGFDENFFLYCEDVDLSWRAKFVNGKCIIMHDSFFFHDISDARDTAFVKTEMLKSGRYLAWKWGCNEFRSIMEAELVKMGFVDSPNLLPGFEGAPIVNDVNTVSSIVEFRRLFTFSSARW